MKIKVASKASETGASLNRIFHTKLTFTRQLFRGFLISVLRHCFRVCKLMFVARKKKNKKFVVMTIKTYAGGGPVLPSLDVMKILFFFLNI